MRRLLPTLVLLALLPFAGGCAYIYGGAIVGGLAGAALTPAPPPPRPDEPYPPGTPVRIDFAQPGTIAGKRFAVDTMRLTGVQTVFGRVAASQGDTLVIALSSVGLADGRTTRFPARPRTFVRLRLDGAIKVTTLPVADPRAIAALGGAAVGAGLTTLGILLLIASSDD